MLQNLRLLNRWARGPVQAPVRVPHRPFAMHRSNPRHGYDMMYWYFGDKNKSLTQLNAKLRVELGPEPNKLHRKNQQVPVCILPRQRLNRQLFDQQKIYATIPKKEIQAARDDSRLYNQVFNIDFGGEREPVKAIVATSYEYYDDTVQNLLFTYFEPNKKYKIKVPALFDNRDECFAIKKGAVLLKYEDYIPMIWTGDERIPYGVIIDVKAAKPPITWKFDKLNIPPGLEMRHPERNHVLGTLRGSRKYYQEE